MIARLPDSAASQMEARRRIEWGEEKQVHVETGCLAGAKCKADVQIGKER